MSRLPVSKMFMENAQGKLQATLRLNDPEIYTDEEDGTKRYIIDLFYVPEKKNAIAIEDVIFYLDETCSEMRLAKRNRDGSFEAVIESNGDFVVTVEVITGGRSFRQQMWLSDMFEAGFSSKDGDREAFDQVLREIREN
jgi:hypothetical protein